MRFGYNFPAHKDVPRDIDGYVRQAEKIVEEANETLQEARRLNRLRHCSGAGVEIAPWKWDEVWHRFRRETLDTIHACETCLRGFGIEDVYDDAKWVEEHDRKRGYYATGGGE